MKWYCLDLDYGDRIKVVVVVSKQGCRLVLWLMLCCSYACINLHRYGTLVAYLIPTTKAFGYFSLLCEILTPPSLNV